MLYPLFLSLVSCLFLCKMAKNLNMTVSLCVNKIQKEISLWVWCGRTWSDPRAQPHLTLEQWTYPPSVMPLWLNECWSLQPGSEIYWKHSLKNWDGNISVHNFGMRWEIWEINAYLFSFSKDLVCPRCDSGFIEEVTEDSRYTLVNI